jgi:hypothetical protein
MVLQIRAVHWVYYIIIAVLVVIAFILSDINSNTRHTAESMETLLEEWRERKDSERRLDLDPDDEEPNY